MSATEGIGKSRPYGEAEPGKAVDEIAEQLPLACIVGLAGLTGLPGLLCCWLVRAP
jgi:hypothetical protein